MANLVRRLKQWPTLHHQVQGCACTTPHHFLSSIFLPLTMTKAVFPHLSLALTAVPFAHRNVHNRTRGLRMPNAPIPSDLQQRGGGGGSDSDERKSRNQLKREARRAVRWAMELASFSTPQIKRILRSGAPPPNPSYYKISFSYYELLYQNFTLIADWPRLSKR
jgi:hypothetical protein